MRERVLKFVNSDFDSAMFFLYMIFYVVCFSISTLLFAAFRQYGLALFPFAGVFISIASTLIHHKGYKKPAALLRTLSTAFIIFWTGYYSGGIGSFPITFLSGAALGAYLVIGKTAGKMVASISILLMGALYMLDLPPSVLTHEQMSTAGMIVQCINIPFVVLVGAIYGARADVFRLRSESEKKKAVQSRQKTATVMDAIRGAIISVDSQMQITEKNNITTEIFGETNRFQDILQHLEVHKPAEMREALATILGEDVLNFEVNEQSLATTAKIKGRRYLITWKPLVDSHNQVKELVIAFIDNEEELKAKEQAVHSDIINSYMGILSDLEQEKSLSIIQNMDEAIAKTRQFLPQGEKRAAFRELHTVKGVARALKFDSVAHTLHLAETALSDPQEALRLLAEVEQEFEKIKLAARKLKYDGNYIKIEKSVVDRALKDNNERAVFMELKYKTLRTVLESFHMTLPDEAKKRHKPSPKLVVDTQKIFLTEAAVQSLSRALTHILSNALDHGIEAPDMRLAHQKTAEGKIMVRAEAGEKLVIHVSDDGAGLAIGRIMAIAKSKQLVDPFKNYSPNEKAAFIFRSEFSTKEQVTETAGRGVGMDAVKASIEAIGGRVWAEVYSDADIAPWELVIELPLDCVVRDPEDTGEHPLLVKAS